MVYAYLLVFILVEAVVLLFSPTAISFIISLNDRTSTSFNPWKYHKIPIMIELVSASPNNSFFTKATTINSLLV